MRNTVFKSRAIKYIIGIAAILVILSVYPCRMWTNDVTSGVKPVSGNRTEVINYRNSFMEVFVADKSHLQSINLYLAEGTYSDEFQVELTDGSGKHMALEKVMPGDIPGYVNILMDVDTTPGELYILKITSLRSLYLGLEDFDPNAGLLVVPYYNDAAIDAKSLVVDFVYRVPYDLPHSLFVIGVTLLIAVVLMAITTMYYKNRADKLLTVETVVKWVCNPLTGLLVLTCLFFIFAGFVTPFLPDKIFAIIATLLLGLLMFFAINHKRYGNDVITQEYLRSHIGDFVQSLGIAYALQGCCAYVSGLYDIHHSVAERKEMIGFAIAIIAMFSFTEIVNHYNIIWVIASVIGGVIYYKNAILQIPPEKITSDDIFVLRANVVIAVLLGIIVIRTIKSLVRKKLGRPNILLGIVTLIYFALIVIFRNTRWWTVSLVVSFLLLFINYGVWNKKENFLTNLVRGVTIQFILCTLWCILYRPYATFGAARYTHYFHTETITATYMTMVLCVFLAMIIRKVAQYPSLEEKEGIKLSLLAYLWKELTLFGMAASYLVFTMSRTAFAAVFIAFLFLIVMVFIKYRKYVNVILKSIGALIVAVLVMLPITFEVQRTVPCLVSKPYEYDIDQYQERVKRGRQLDSFDYMMVGRFANVFAEKILGIDGDVVPNYYLEDIPYDEYHASFRDVYYAADGYKFTEFDMADEEWDRVMVESATKYQAYLDRVYPRDEEGNVIYPEITADTEETVTDEIPADMAFAEQTVSSDYTNGRIDIYKSYISQLNLTGHDTMGATLKNGEIATHAHDVYLQVAYDHGIPTALIFVVFGVTSLIMGIIFFMKNKDKYDALTMTVILAFAVAGVVEWVFHLSHPMSFIMLLSITPLMFMHKSTDTTESCEK